jgi:hypothetical protein
MALNVWDERIIGSARDWRDEIIIGESLALAADVYT